MESLLLIYLAIVFVDIFFHQIEIRHWTQTGAAAGGPGKPAINKTVKNFTKKLMHVKLAVDTLSTHSNWQTVIICTFLFTMRGSKQIQNKRKT